LALDGFLPAWIEILTANTNGYWARDRQRLLTEATVWHAGTDGLATVARQPISCCFAHITGLNPAGAQAVCIRILDR